MRLAPALLAGALGAPVFGQDFDPRPIYYTMLQAAESSFAERVATLESARRSDQAALGRRAARARVRFDRERVRIEREQRAWERAFEAEREALNARIARLGAAPVEVTALVAAAEAEFEGARVAVNAVRARYRALALEARARRDALESAARAYRDRDGEAAREIDRLARAFEAFHAEQSAASDARAAERRREAQEFDGWQQEEIARLRDVERRRAAAAEAYAALAREHERRLGALNRLVRAYNERGRSGAPGEAEGAASGDLAREIQRRKGTLAALRAQALALAREVEARGEAARARQQWFDGERTRREQALIREAEALRAENERTRARIEARRRETQTRIEALEARVAAGLRALAEKRSEAVRRIDGEFGPDPEALLDAAAEWLESGGPSLLHHADGRERFAPAPPRAGALYDAIDAARRALRRVVDAGKDPLAERWAAWRQERDAIAERRQELLAARLASASRQARRRSGREARRDAAQREIAHLRAASRSEFQTGLARLVNEFQPVQRVLLEVLDAAPPVLPEATGGEGRPAARSGEEVSPSDPFDAPPALPRGFLRDFAAAGRKRDPRATLMRWGRLHPGPYPETRVLEGDEKRRLLARWYGLLSARGVLDPLAHRLSRLLPAHSGADLEHGLYGLFEAGMQERSEILEHRGEGREPGYEVRILGRRYRLDPDGRLLLAPWR